MNSYTSPPWFAGIAKGLLAFILVAVLFVWLYEARPSPTRAQSPRIQWQASPLPSANPAPIVLQGIGRTATDEFVLPARVSVAQFSHRGDGNFIVKIFRGGNQDLLINAIGKYDGRRPLIDERRMLQVIVADGRWSVRVMPISVTRSQSFAGRDDSVTGFFAPAQAGPWEISHDGSQNFIVRLHCTSGCILLQADDDHVLPSIRVIATMMILPPR